MASDEKTTTADATGGGELRKIGVWLPSSVTAIIEAALATDPERAERAGIQFAMAAIIGALPWIAVAVHAQASPAEYHAFAEALRGEIEGAWSIIRAKDPKAAFERAFAEAQRAQQ